MARHFISHARESPNGYRRGMRSLVDGPATPAENAEGTTSMRLILSALIALSALAGIATAVSAATDAKQFFEQQERWSGGGQ
jgi:hypothetical protein